ncbi:hypothetical protein [Exiguobacterium sp. 17-1]|uniref:hypothetical protein n=1 Tax=Exiguobacterium sp. 17-1 TaxID=2931981 RepID=UPI001FFF17BF|nr:hypothetical protein [Exiguobacterium sp. 17-1]MCK2157312.1 hypothetical protein [Exiguobacterium sp. 17-1]
MKKTISTALLSLALLVPLSPDAIAETNGPTTEQKNEWYQQYEIVIESVNQRHPDGELELAPIYAFRDEDWRPVEEFRKIAEKRSTFQISLTSNEKQAVKEESASEINVRPDITTAYSQSAGRHLCSDTVSVTSESRTKGKWIQKGYTATRIDANQTYEISLGGYYTMDGIVTGHIPTIEFHCGRNGEII